MYSKSAIGIIVNIAGFFKLYKNTNTNIISIFMFSIFIRVSRYFLHLILKTCR